MNAAQGLALTNLVDRVRAILLRPKDEWPVIETEQTDAATLYRGYIVPLAAIGPVAAWIGGSLIYRTPIITGLAQAIVSYILTLIGTYLFALIIDGLAPSFGGTRNRMQALKVAAYASTATWLAGIFSIIPGLSVLGLLGLYSLYLLYLGLPVLMKVPQDKAVTYTAAVVVLAIVMYLVIGLVAAIPTLSLV